MHVLSALPGRVRWHIPSLVDQPALAEGVSEALRQEPPVRAADSNPLTGNMLLTFDREWPVADAQRWVQRALGRALAAPVRIEAGQRPAETSSTQVPLARLIDLTRAHRPLVARMLTTSFFNRLLDSSPPILIGAGIDIVTLGRSSVLGWMGMRSVRSQLFTLGGIGLGIWAADAVLDYLHRSSAAELANVVRNDLRNQLYQHLQQLDLAQIESRDVSSWINLLESDLSRIHSFIKDATDPIITIVANGVAVAGTILALAPSFALAQLLLIPPVLIVSKELLGPLKRRLEIAQREGERLSALLHGNVSSLSTINSFATQELEAERVIEAGLAQMTTARDANNMSAIYVPTLAMIVGTGFMGTLVYGGLKVQSGDLAPGAYNVVAATQLRMLAAIGYFGTSLESYQRTSVSLNRVFKVLDMKPAIVSPPQAVPFEHVKRDILFDNVTFGYEPDRQVLRQLQLRFPAGKTIGIVGSSGAGKTTVLKLLLRFYDAQSGAVRYDGVDVKELRLDDLRKAVAMVSQEVAIFAGTVRDNVAYARPEATADQVRQAAELAEAHEFISRLPDGYDTRIGFGGTNLSAGQRQRLAIARVVLADRPILLFDEATSALDYETEAAVQRSLRTVTAGRTTIIVAHRLSTIRRAHLIYVLDDGQVKEQGRHHELIDADGIYASMWKVQTGEGLKHPPGTD